MVQTSRDGRKFEVVGSTTVCGHTADIVRMIPETQEEIIKKFCKKATVFVVERGIGISCSHLYLYPDGTIHNGAGDGVWTYNSEEEANNFLVDFKESHNE